MMLSDIPLPQRLRIVNDEAQKAGCCGDDGRYARFGDGDEITFTWTDKADGETLYVSHVISASQTQVKALAGILGSMHVCAMKSIEATRRGQLNIGDLVSVQHGGCRTTPRMLFRVEAIDNTVDTVTLRRCRDVDDTHLLAH
jgi:hypothetical protein